MSSQSTSRSISVTDTAKLIRSALKAQFPGVKFSVRSRSYAGGASIDIKWTDGPRDSEVNALASLYRGSWFDGHTDCKHYMQSMLSTDDGAEVVRFGADFVFCTRECSRGRQAVNFAELRRYVRHLTGETLPFDPRGWHSLTVPVTCCTGRHMDAADEMFGRLAHKDWDHSSVWSVLHQMADRAWEDETCEGGEGTYCPGCGRFQGDNRSPHKR